MLAHIQHILRGSSNGRQPYFIRSCEFLIDVNVAAWAWSLMTFLRHPMGTDRVAAIATITRKPMPENRWANAADFRFLISHDRVKHFKNLAVSPQPI